jgi:hypothetical protein
MTHDDLDIPAAGSMSDPTLLERVQNQMETTFVTWKLLTAGDPVGPKELAIVSGMMDSIGQLLEADVGITSKAMENVLGKSTAALCWTAGRDPALQSWVTAGGQAVRDVARGRMGSPDDILAALVRRRGVVRQQPANSDLVWTWLTCSSPDASELRYLRRRRSVSGD